MWIRRFYKDKILLIFKLFIYADVKILSEEHVGLWFFVPEKSVLQINRNIAIYFT